MGVYELSYDGGREWERVDEPRVRKVFGNVFTSVELMMDELVSGYTVYTPFAQYRLVRVHKGGKVIRCSCEAGEGGVDSGE